MKLTKNFDSDEFECKCHKCDGGAMQVDFIMRLQRVREVFGKSMLVTSGYRCHDHNKKVGGVNASFHTKGRAADIAMTSSYDRYHLVEAAIEAEMTGIGISDGFLHLDNRDGDGKIWRY